MTRIEEQLRTLLREHLTIADEPLHVPEDLNTNLRDLGVSSLDVLRFAKLVSAEFDVTLNPEDCQRLTTLKELVAFLESPHPNAA